jgi:hypothetical protein
MNVNLWAIFIIGMVAAFKVGQLNAPPIYAMSDKHFKADIDLIQSNSHWMLRTLELTNKLEQCKKGQSHD